MMKQISVLVLNIDAYGGPESRGKNPCTFNSLSSCSVTGCNEWPYLGLVKIIKASVTTMQLWVSLVQIFSSNISDVLFCSRNLCNN